MEKLGFGWPFSQPFGMALACLGSKHSGMVRFYWAIVVAATLTIIAVVAFSKDKKDISAVRETRPVEKVVHAGDLSANIKP